MINITVSEPPKKAIKTDAQVLVFSSLDGLKKMVKKTPLDKTVSYLISQKYITSDQKECLTVPVQTGTQLSTSILVPISSEKDSLNALRNAGGQASRACKNATIKHATVQFEDSQKDAEITQFCEGMILGAYEFLAFKTDKKEPQKSLKIQLMHKKADTLNGLVANAVAYAEAQNIARDLANTPANYLRPEDFVAYAKQLFKSTKVSVKIFSKRQLESMKMGALLAVAKGSSNAPYMIQLSLNTSRNKKPIVLVGKGVTFDTGGISIKPSKSMSQMKADMSGGAAVCGALYGLEKSKATQSIVGLIPLVENMPSGEAYKPGDVITAMNGKTIEVINTDAEGRLILADALCFAATMKPELLVDIATLTGACSIALGDLASALLGNHDTHIKKALTHEQQTGERLWQLPLFDDYFKSLKSDVADMTNGAEDRLAGTIVAAKFLEKFVDKLPWLHLDIASTMHQSSTTGCHVKGMTGVGTRTLIAIANQL